MRKEKRNKRKGSLTQAELRALGCVPGLQAIRYGPDGERVTIRQLTAETRSGSSFGRNLTSGREHADITQESEGER
jgi:hypothetical protein